MLARMQGKGGHLFIVGKSKNWYMHVEISYCFLRKLELSLLHYPATPLLDIPSGLYILLQRHMLIRVHCCIILNSQKLETAQMSIS